MSHHSSSFIPTQTCSSVKTPTTCLLTTNSYSQSSLHFQTWQKLLCPNPSISPPCIGLSSFFPFPIDITGTTFSTEPTGEFAKKLLDQQASHLPGIWQKGSWVEPTFSLDSVGFIYMVHGLFRCRGMVSGNPLNAHSASLIWIVTEGRGAEVSHNSQLSWGREHWQYSHHVSVRAQRLESSPDSQTWETMNGGIQFPLTHSENSHETEALFCPESTL